MHSKKMDHEIKLLNDSESNDWGLLFCRLATQGPGRSRFHLFLLLQLKPHHRNFWGKNILLLHEAVM